MACVIAESARVLKPGALQFMVNDSVRYAGTSISVDMILSDMAEQLGFYVENTLILANGKGKSSQQKVANKWKNKGAKSLGSAFMFGEK